MTRAVILLLAIVAILAGATVWLAGRTREVPQTRIEQTVPLNAPAR